MSFCELGLSKFVKKLSNYVNINSTDCEGKNAIWYCVSSSRQEKQTILKILLLKGGRWDQRTTANVRLREINF